MNCRNRSRRLLGAKFKNPYLFNIYINVLEQWYLLDKVFFSSLLLVDRAIPKAQKISPPYSVTGRSQLLCNPAYSHLFNKRGGWNKQGGGAKVAKLLNVEVGINVEGGIFWKKTST